MAFVYHQVFCDESGKFQQDPLIAFSAVSATADRLQAFDAAWRTLLRSYDLLESGLHMERASRLVEDVGYRLRKGQTVGERTELLLPFADCINQHLEFGMTEAWDVRGINHLPQVVIETLGGTTDPYFWALTRGFTWLADHIAEEDHMSIICDDDPYTAWNSYMHFRSLGKVDFRLARAAVSLSFANDKHFPALQAADMLAFLTRHEANEQFNEVPNMWRALFDRLVTEPSPPYGIMRWYKMFADEEKLFEFGKENLEAAERAVRERKEQRDKRIRAVRPDNARSNQRPPQRDKSGTGSGESGEKEKAEG
jgi:hypothetical protein